MRSQSYNPRPFRTPPRTGMMPVMAPIYDPAQFRHPKRLEFAIHAAWISSVAAAQRDLEDLLIDVPPEERELPDFSAPWPWEFDSFVVALSVVQETREAAEQSLEELVAA
jgi:hypothetical protein